MKNRLTLILKYNALTDKFDTTTDMTLEGQVEIISDYLRIPKEHEPLDVIPNVQENYKLVLQWEPGFPDRFYTKSDTGSKAVDDGILMKYLSGL